MRPIAVRVGPLAAASANAVALSQPGAAGVPLTINGALAVPVRSQVYGSGPGTGMVTAPVAVTDTPRRIAVTSAGNDSGITFTIIGTDRTGNIVSETLAGANASTVQSALDYASVTSITPSGGTAANVTVGTTSVASSAWVRLDNEGIPQTSVQAVVTGTVTATIEQTLDDPNSLTDPIAPGSMIWFPNQDPAAVNFTTSFQTNYAEIPLFARITLTAGTGSVQARFAQVGSASPS